MMGVEWSKLGESGEEAGLGEEMEIKSSVLDMLSLGYLLANGNVKQAHLKLREEE